MNAVAYVLVIIGALNWGLVGISPNLDLVQLLVGSWSEVVARIVYILVGLSALWLIVKRPGAKREAPAAPAAPEASSMDQQM